MVYVGIDVGGTGLKAGIVDESGKVLNKCTCPTGVERGHEAVINDMAHLALQAIEEGGFTLDDVKAIGVGIPGIQDPKTNRIPFCTNLFWHDVPLVELMQKVIDKPVFVGNDATVAGLAEAVAGVSAGVKDSVFVTLGTGVGGGIIIVAGGELCTCGNRGCWERYASATAIIRMGREVAEKNPSCGIAKAVGGDLSKITAKTVIDLAKAGDPDAAQVFDQYVYYLCVGLISIINMIDPEMIVLGGGVSGAGEFLLTAVRKKMEELVFYKSMDYARIELAVLGNDAGIIGAAMLGK